jgi:predicted DNA-binding ribbon-helix-helix protein
MKKRSVKISGHATSVSLEEPFWDALKKLSDEEKTSLNNLIDKIDKARAGGNLSSALRLYVLSDLQKRLLA